MSEAEAKSAEPRAVEEHVRSEHLRKKARVFEQRLARSERPFEEEQAAKSTTDQMTWCAAEVEEYESMIGELTEELREFRAKDLSMVEPKPQSRTLEVNTPSFSPLGKRCGGCIKKSSAFKLSGGAWRRRVKDRISIFLPGDHREVPLNDIKKVGSSKTAPYSAFFSEVIAPAMLNTGASPEQI